jgi:exo-beta-1,3-glucanase (GH17 family)
MVSFETIVFDHAGSNALATSFSSSFSVFASLNGFSSNPAAGDAFGTSTVTITPTPSGSSQTFATGVTFSFGSAFQNLTSASTVTFRIYGFDNSDSNDQIPRVDNIQVTGSAVPEPSTYVLLGVAMLGLVAFRRRRVA